MNINRNGKIARLPRLVREELNQRLSDGGIGCQLVDWLNTLPEVQAVLAAHFGSRPITEANLTLWKQGGFEDWQRHEETRAWVGHLVEESDDLEGTSGATRLADRVAVPVLMELVKLLRKAAASDDLAEQRKTVFGVAQQLARLRRADHEARRVRLKEARWEIKQEDRNAQKDEATRDAARETRVRQHFSPQLDEDCLPKARPTEIQVLLASSARLRQKAGLPASSPSSPDSSPKPPKPNDPPQAVRPNSGKFD